MLSPQVEQQGFWETGYLQGSLESEKSLPANAEPHSFRTHNQGTEILYWISMLRASLCLFFWFWWVMEKGATGSHWTHEVCSKQSFMCYNLCLNYFNMPLEIKTVIWSRNNLEGVFDDPPLKHRRQEFAKGNLICCALSFTLLPMVLIFWYLNSWPRAHTALVEEKGKEVLLINRWHNSFTLNPMLLFFMLFWDRVRW